MLEFQFPSNRSILMTNVNIWEYEWEISCWKISWDEIFCMSMIHYSIVFVNTLLWASNMLSDGVNEPNKFSIIIVAINSFSTYGTAETFCESTVQVQFVGKNPVFFIGFQSSRSQRIFEHHRKWTKGVGRGRRTVWWLAVTLCVRCKFLPPISSPNIRIKNDTIDRSRKLTWSQYHYVKLPPKEKCSPDLLFLLSAGPPWSAWEPWPRREKSRVRWIR